MYQKTPTTLGQASQDRVKTKITTIGQDAHKYDYISWEDGVFYGVKKNISGKEVKTELREAEIREVCVKDRGSSTLASISVLALSALVFGAIVYGADITVFGQDVE
jgi:hypothetical protein